MVVSAANAGRPDPERYTVDGVGRMYTDGQAWLPSVTTVLDMMPKPDALRNWEQRTDDPEAVKTYKQNRGTLVHYDCQNTLVEYDMWGSEEQNSLQELKDDFAEYNSRRQAERKWARQTWKVMCRISGISPDSLIDTETYVMNHDVGYAGQFDILYQDGKDTVLADIKTSKYVYDKFPLQLVAYKHAVPMAIDRLEIHRLNPDFQDWEIVTSDDWNRSEATLWSKFTSLRDELEKKHLDSLLETIQERAESTQGQSAPQR